MAKKRKDFCGRYVADFETITKEPSGVWAWAVTKINDESDYVEVGNHIDTFFSYLRTLGENPLIYFHNLRWDGTFIVIELLKKNYKWVKDEPQNGEFTTLISADGAWYWVKWNDEGQIFTLWDSFKLIPMSVKKIGDPKKGFGTKHQKTNIDYDGHDKPGELITKEEEEYIKNDVLVVKEAIEMMYSEGNDRMTIGSCVIKKMEETLIDFQTDIPTLDYKLCKDLLGNVTADEYCRMFYRGGISIVDDENGGKFIKGVGVIDYNSMYPSMMLGAANNKYPHGKPRFFVGEVPFFVKNNPDKYTYMVHIKCDFVVKDNHIPTIQIKDNGLFFPYREYVRTTKVLGEWRTPELYLTEPDYINFLQQYDIIGDIKFIDGVWAYADTQIFDIFIKPITEKKENAPTLALRTIYKLDANNSYGRIGISSDSSYKIPHLENGILKFTTVKESERKVLNVMLAAFITAYARKTLIETAQKFKDVHCFCYSDTDSIHYKITRESLEILKTIPLDKKKLLNWDVEVPYAHKAIFLRPKTYGEEIKTGKKKKWEITACGLSKEGKEHFANDMREFKFGAELPNGKTVVRQIEGGCILKKEQFSIRKKISKIEVMELKREIEKGR